MFYWESVLLKINPYFRKTVILAKESFLFLLLIFGFYSIFSEITKIKILGFLILIFVIFVFLRKNSSKEDVREAKEEGINLDDYLTKDVKNFLIEIITKEEILNTGNIKFLILKEILKRKEIKKILDRLNVELNEIELNKFLSKKEVSDIKVHKTSSEKLKEEILPILISSFNLAKSLNHPNINFQILFYGLRENLDENLIQIFEEKEIKKEFLLTAILMENYAPKVKLKSKFQPLSAFQYNIKKKSILNRALTTQATRLLDSYGVDFTYLATKESAGYLIGHKKELEEIINSLISSRNVILVGDEGSGKEAIILHLAWLIQNELAPKELLDYRLVKLDLSLVYSGDKERFLETLSKIFEEVFKSKRIILYFPYIHNILLQKESGILQILTPVLNSRSVPVIATTTLEGYLRSKQVADIDEYFEKIDINPLSQEESIYLLTLKSLIWEKENKIIITPQSIATAVQLADELIKDIPLPQSAENVILEAISLAKKLKSKYLTKEIIQELISEKTKIPVKEITEKEKEKLLNLEELLHQRIVNQDYAIKEIARVLKIYRAGLDYKKGPIGVFLFVGPTGVGKTETAKALAKIYFGSTDAMIRLDMVEFQNSEDIDKLIGSPDGKILGRLTEAVRQNPYSLILLDEFEKTHPAILKIFLPIFDEGEIKDALGRNVNFKNTLIICTSNAYSEDIKKGIEQEIPFEKIVSDLKSKLSQIFSVELLNRFDNIIVYKPLGEIELLKIAEIILNDFKNDLVLKHGIDLEVSENALKEIVKLGTDPIYGARPLKRKIDEILKSEIANIILGEKIKRGQKIYVDFKENFVFEVRWTRNTFFY